MMREELEAVLERLTALVDYEASGWDSDAPEYARYKQAFSDLRALRAAVVERDALRTEVERLNAIVNSPQSDDFLRAVSTEAEHQRQRWGNDHDGGKEPSDWFWLIGYLAGKALNSHKDGKTDKAEHHIITTAAACANWHRAVFGQTNMRPGIDAAAIVAAVNFLREQGPELLAVLGEARKEITGLANDLFDSATIDGEWPGDKYSQQDQAEHARLTALVARLDTLAGAAE